MPFLPVRTANPKTKLKTPDGPITREIVYRDWRVTNTVATEKTEIVVGDSGGLFSERSCAFFQDNLQAKGCEHMLALFKERMAEKIYRLHRSSAPASVRPSSAGEEEMAVRRRD
jgi:hypothetical protein